MLKISERKNLRKSAFLSFFLFFFILLLIFSTTIIPKKVSGELTDDDFQEQEDNDEDGIDDKIEEINERSLQIEVEENQVEIQSELKNGTIKDKIELSFTTSDEPEFNIGYRSKSESVETEISFEVSFFSLIEFNDTNGNNVFDDSSEQEFQEFELDTNYDPITHIVHSDALGHEIHTFNTTSEDKVFSVQFSVVTSFSQLNGRIIVPSEIKMDLAIINFPFNESTSKLALYTKLKAENEFEIDYETEDEYQNRSKDESEVELTIGENKGFFSWSEKVLIDGINRTIYNSNVESDNSDGEKIYLIYDQGSIIIHDPKIGIEGVTKLVIPYIPPELLLNIITIFVISKEEYLLPLMVLTTIMLPLSWGLYRKNQVL